MDGMYARRIGAVAEFLLPHLRSGTRLIDCGCGPESITVDLAEAIAPGEVVGIDLRDDALAHARETARNRGISNVQFQRASIYQLPYPAALATRHLHVPSSNICPLLSKHSRRYVAC
jgi:ubiquinone/menaquinone biosynthesis C-methylase UbiE